jgi:hypothetical protein
MPRHTFGPIRRQSLLDFERIRFLRLLFSGYLEFRPDYLIFQNEGQIPRARIIEHLCQGIFSDLRTCAHRVFGPSREGSESLEAAPSLPTTARDYELLCDLVVGACYHEMLQLQENLYLVKLYRPRYEELRSHLSDQTLDEFFQVGGNLVEEAAQQIPKNLNWIWQLIQEALRLLKIILAAYPDNRVLLRFLTQNLPFIEQVYDKADLDDLFGRMYARGLRQALWESVIDLVKAAHYDSALDVLGRLMVLEKTAPDQRFVSCEQIREVLEQILKAAREYRANDLVNRCEMCLVQVRD